MRASPGLLAAVLYFSVACTEDSATPFDPGAGLGDAGRVRAEGTRSRRVHAAGGGGV